MSTTYRVVSNLRDPLDMSGHISVIEKGLRYAVARHLLHCEAMTYIEAGLSVSTTCQGDAIVIVFDTKIKIVSIQRED